MSSAIDSTAENNSTASVRRGQNPRLFLSYSRAQFYFAESLAYALQARDFDVWFDSQRLTTGTEWAAEIMRGIASSDVLLLVGSKQSLESVAVRHEWTTAVGQGKKIVVALFEHVELPGELDAAVIVDFRRSFDSGLANLRDILSGHSALQERARSESASGFGFARSDHQMGTYCSCMRGCVSGPRGCDEQAQRRRKHSRLARPLSLYRIPVRVCMASDARLCPARL